MLSRRAFARSHEAGDEFGESADGAIERAVLARAVARLLEAAIRDGAGSEQACALRCFMSAHDRTLGASGGADAWDRIDFAEMSRAERQRSLRAMLKSIRTEPVRGTSALGARVAFLADLLSLSEVDREVLATLARRAVFSAWQFLFRVMSRHDSVIEPVVAAIADMPLPAVYRAFSDSGDLVTKGLAHEHSCRASDLILNDFVVRFLKSDAKSERDMFGALMPTAAPSRLDRAAYDHLGPHFERAKRLIDHSLRGGERANILLYGAPGTGKTEFARLLADTMELPAVSVGEADEEGGEPTRDERLLHLALARKLVERRRAALLVIDEAEDLFLFGPENRGSKLWLNKLVEDGTGPHVWIVNDPSLLGEPVVRRMDMAVEFSVPPASARRRMVEKLLRQPSPSTIASHPDDRSQVIEALAGLNASPAILATAVQTVSRTGENLEAAVAVATGLAEACGQGVPDLPDGKAAFDPSLCSASTDLVELAGKLAGSESNWSLLLSGPPGTGKSAYARFLAERCGIDLIRVSGADLLGPYVGQTEALIAKAFARAEQSRALLLIDEADSFLGSRDMAQRNWEVSMTNEMLRQIERGRARFVATTNRAAVLDPASARRFALHVEFGPLTPEQARTLFEHVFGLPAPLGMKGLAELTPGDFAQVRQRAALLGEVRARVLMEWLAETAQARQGGRGKLGF